MAMCAIILERASPISTHFWRRYVKTKEKIIMNINSPVINHHHYHFGNHAQVVIVTPQQTQPPAPRVAVQPTGLPKRCKLVPLTSRVLADLLSLAILLATDGPSILEWLGL
jgi:hypothetical protein